MSTIITGSIGATMAAGVFDLARAAMGIPLVTLAIAAVIFATLAFVQSARRPAEAAVADDAAGRYLPELGILGAGALGVIILSILDSVVRGYVLNLANAVSWWAQALPVLVAAIVVALVLVRIATRGSSPSTVPVGPSARRGWLTFLPRADLIAGVAVFAALIATTLAAGLASSPDAEGRYVHLVLPMANTQVDPLRVWFFGWAYGVPVLICATLLAVVLWAALAANARRPFLRPATVADERRMRTRVTRAASHVAVGGLLLSLGSAWRFVAEAGGTNTLTDPLGTYEVTWRYADLAAAAGWLAPVVEIAGFVVLLLVAREVRVAHASVSDMRAEAAA
ncbi:MAG: hypothetical protein ACQEW8_11890 [Actinomycetota bacterium]